MGSPVTVAEIQAAAHGADSRTVVQLLGLGAWTLVGHVSESPEGWAFRTGESRPALPPSPHGEGLLPGMTVWPVTPRRPRPGRATQVVLVGRSRSNDVVIDHTGVSKLHARIHLADGTCAVEDAGSRNGTSVNGRAVVAETRVRLHNGDMIVFGGVALTVYSTPSLLGIVRKLGPG
ncbi:MAG: FHA domain-containing protein [Deltaproteobacteria bacterium]|nr:FHA domain-containing protein [Deltaproteobacteria bacterium]